VIAPRVLLQLEVILLNDSTFSITEKYLTIDEHYYKVQSGCTSQQYVVNASAFPASTWFIFTISRFSDKADKIRQVPTDTVAIRSVHF
jgi:hypothetical protein